MAAFLLVSLVYCVHSQIPGPIEATLSCFNGEYANDVDPSTQAWWFQLDIDRTQTVTFSNCYSDFDTVMAVYEDVTSTSINEPFCDGTYGNYDDCNCPSAGGEAYTIPNMAAGTYYVYIRFWSFGTPDEADSPPPTSGHLELLTTGCTSDSPTQTPSDTPTEIPTQTPTAITASPSDNPTQSPIKNPTMAPIIPSVSPTQIPSPNPSSTPTSFPSENPVVTANPTYMPSSMPSETHISVTTAPSVSPTVPATNGNIWTVLFRLILKYIQNFDPVSDMQFKAFITATTKQAIYFQLASANAAENNFENFGITMTSLTDTTDGVKLNFKITTNDGTLSDKIENVLQNNMEHIIAYILNELLKYLSNPSNGYHSIDTQNLELEITNVDGNNDGSVNDISSTVAANENNGENSTKFNEVPQNMLYVYIICGSVFVICAVVIGTFCYLQRTKKDEMLSSLKRRNEMELQTHQMQRLQSNEVSTQSNIINGKSVSAFSSDNDVISTPFSANNNGGTQMDALHSNSNEIENDESESSSEEIQKIQQTIQIQQQMWIQKQIANQQKKKQELEIQLQQKQLLNSLPAAPSGMLLDMQHTARMSMDPNGVPDLLNVDEQAEMDAYHEGAGVEPNMEDVNEAGPGEQDQMEVNNAVHNFQPLPQPPHINNNIYETRGNSD